MVDRYIAKLNLTPEQVAAYNPPKGIDVGWFNWEKPDVVVAVFVGSDLHPNPLYRKTANQLRDEVHTTFRNRIVEDNLQTYFNLPPRLMKIETILEHPDVTSRESGASREIIKAAEGATEVHDVEMTKEEFERLRKPQSGQEITPREIRRRRQTITERTPEGRLVQREIGSEEEIYIMTSGIIDIG